MARRIVRPRARSLKTWVSTNSGTTGGGLKLTLPVVVPAAGAGGVGSSVGFAGADVGEDFTLFRTRGAFQVRHDLGNDDLVMVNLGIGVVTEQAATAGAGAFPNPVTNADWDGWLAFYSMLITGGSNEANSPSLTQVIDSKAMRKVHGGNVLLIVAQTEGLFGNFAGTVDLGLFARFLLKTS